jgi:AbrB family looped-hinge helix DNA binding protein
MQTSTTNNNQTIPMKHLMTVARKGQITLPAVIREALQIKEGDTIEVELQGEAVKITPVSFTLESVYGSVQPRQQPENFAEMIRLAKEEKAERTLEKLQTP